MIRASIIIEFPFIKSSYFVKLCCWNFSVRLSLIKYFIHHRTWPLPKTSHPKLNSVKTCVLRKRKQVVKLCQSTIICCGQPFVFLQTLRRTWSGDPNIVIAVIIHRVRSSPAGTIIVDISCTHSLISLQSAKEITEEARPTWNNRPAWHAAVSTTSSVEYMHARNWKWSTLEIIASSNSAIKRKRTSIHLNDSSNGAHENRFRYSPHTKPGLDDINAFIPSIIYAHFCIPKNKWKRSVRARLDRVDSWRINSIVGHLIRSGRVVQTGALNFSWFWASKLNQNSRLAPGDRRRYIS